MSVLSLEQRAYLMKLIHHDKKIPGLDASVLAGIFGVDTETYLCIRKGFADRARAAAKELLQDKTFAEKIDSLPFASGDTVLGLGDSLTDDDESWIEIFRHLLYLQRQDSRINFVNAGISGDTTMEMLSRFPSVVAQKPSWIICLAGTNDACRIGDGADKSLISTEETAKNLAALRNFARRETKARWVWMTPLPVIEEAARNHWMTKSFGCWWRNEDLAAVADIVRSFSDPIADLRPLFGEPVNPELFLADGLHPSIEGQKAILRSLVDVLVR